MILNNWVSDDQNARLFCSFFFSLIVPFHQRLKVLEITSKVVLPPLHPQ